MIICYRFRAAGGAVQLRWTLSPLMWRCASRRAPASQPSLAASTVITDSRTRPSGPAVLQPVPAFADLLPSPWTIRSDLPRGGVPTVQPPSCLFAGSVLAPQLPVGFFVDIPLLQEVRVDQNWFFQPDHIWIRILREYLNEWVLRGGGVYTCTKFKALEAECFGNIDYRCWVVPMIFMLQGWLEWLRKQIVWTDASPPPSPQQPTEECAFRLAHWWPRATVWVPAVVLPTLQLTEMFAMLPATNSAQPDPTPWWLQKPLLSTCPGCATLINLQSYWIYILPRNLCLTSM
jgi:hypothetical protein